MGQIGSEDLESMRDTLRQFLAREVSQEVLAKWHADGMTPPSFLQNLAELGVCGLVVPEDYGGMGLEVAAMTMVIRELARHHVPLAEYYIMNSGYAGLNLSFSGTKAQKDALLPKVLDGRLIFALGLSEPDVGADLTSVKTTAERHGDTIVVNGMKRWCSGSDIAQYIYALVRSGPKQDRRRNLSFVLIPTDAKGVTHTRVKTMATRGFGHNDVTFDNVEIPIDNLVGGESEWNNGWAKLAGPTLEIEKLMPSSLAVGVGEAAMDEAWQYAQEREQFGKRICAHQSVRHMLAEAQTKLQASRLMLEESVRLVDAGLPSAVQTSMTKLFVADTVLSQIIQCQQVMGAYGYAEGFKMESLVRDALVFPIFGGSSAIQKNNIANLMRLPRQ